MNKDPQKLQFKGQQSPRAAKISPNDDQTEDPENHNGALDPKTKRVALLKEFDKKYRKVIKRIHNKEEDPLRELGPGISTYH